MPTLLQINVSANWGSTGKIAEQINQVAQSIGWKTYLAYGREMQHCKSELIHVGNKMQVYEHYLEHLLLDNDGLASRLATKHLIRNIESIKPDIINLHNIHDHWLNYRILFEYLNTKHIPIVWTQHDCWAFTGGCFHFTLRNCYRWKDGGCSNGCPWKQNRRKCLVFENTTKQYQLKHNLFTNTKNMVLVPVSHWLEELERQSFLSCHRIQTIHNGIDISVFKPTDSIIIKQKYGIENRSYVIGVSSVWLPYKGWNDFLKLSEKLPQGLKMVLVGLTKEKIKEAEKYGIVGIQRTENVKELAALYSGAKMFCNLTYEDNYPTTNLEAMACGTPVLTYRTGGSPEAVTEETGWVIEQGNIEFVANVVEEWIKRIVTNPIEEQEMRKKCRERAEKEFDKKDKYKEYMDLYNDLLV